MTSFPIEGRLRDLAARPAPDGFVLGTPPVHISDALALLAPQRLQTMGWPEDTPIVSVSVEPMDGASRGFDGEVRNDVRFVSLGVADLNNHCLLFIVGRDFKLVDRVAEEISR